jgi:hypothetical protein
MLFDSGDISNLMYEARHVAGPRHRMRLEISAEVPGPKCEVVMARVFIAGLGEIGLLAETELGVTMGMEPKWRKTK